MASTSGIGSYDVIWELQKKFGVRKVLGRIKNLVTAVDPHHKLYPHIVAKNADMIVINCKDVGVSCLNYLREKQLGIETFLPLDYDRNDVLCTSVRFRGHTYPMSPNIMRKSFKYNPKIVPAVKFLINDFNSSNDGDNILQSDFTSNSGKANYKTILENDIALYCSPPEEMDYETRANLNNMIDLVNQCSKIITGLSRVPCTDKLWEDIYKLISSGSFGTTITEYRNRFAENMKLKKRFTFKELEKELLIIGASEIIDTVGLAAFKRVFDYVYLRIECSSQQIIEALNYSESDAGIPSITAGIISGIMPEDGPYADFTNMTHLERISGAIAMLLGLWKYNPSNFIYLNVINVNKLANFMTTVCYQKKVLDSLKNLFFKRRFLEAYASLESANDTSPEDSVESLQDSPVDLSLECMIFHLEL